MVLLLEPFLGLVGDKELIELLPSELALVLAILGRSLLVGDGVVLRCQEGLKDGVLAGHQCHLEGHDDWLEAVAASCLWYLPLRLV